jgi:DNA-binding GntR family transcriptional regulator
MIRMSELQIHSAAEQVAGHLRDGLQRGVWTETMTGGARLSRELGVGRMTVEAALSQLQSEGLLVAQGALIGDLSLCRPGLAWSL